MTKSYSARTEPVVFTATYEAAFGANRLCRELGSPLAWGLHVLFVVSRHFRDNGSSLYESINLVC